MQQRRSDAAGEAAARGRPIAPPALNYFPTPPFATRALCEFLAERVGDLRAQSCWEPACGEGHMVGPLREYFGQVRASDVHRYDYGRGGLMPSPLCPWHDLADFTMATESADAVDWVITNPPFLLALDFIQAAARVARKGFAMLVRSAFLEGADRYQRLWSAFPPAFVLQFTERVVLLENRLVQSGAVDPFADKPDTKASTATAYVWLVWTGGQFDTRLRWIAPCRGRLERPGDYPDYSAEALPPPADGLFGPPAGSATGLECGGAMPANGVRGTP